MAEELGKDPKYKDLVIGTYEGTKNSLAHTKQVMGYPSVVLYTAKDKSEDIGMDKYGKNSVGANGWSGIRYEGGMDHTPDNMKAFL